MGILSKTAKVTVNSNSIKFLQEKGYDIIRYIVNKQGISKTRYDLGRVIDVKIEDLWPNCNALVDVQCDSCGIIKTVSYQNYRVQMEKYNSYHCTKCKQGHAKITNLEKYNYDNVLKVPEIKEKARQTELNRTREQNDAILEKRKKTSQFHFGTDYPSQSPIVRERIIKTNRERYNVDYPNQNPLVFEKQKQKNFEKYGVEFCSQIPEVKEKIVNTLNNKGIVATSMPQIYIYNLYLKYYPNTELNKAIKYYFGDIVIDNIVIEIDFAGHDLSVKLGSITQEDFNKKQIIRAKTLKKDNYKIIRIISAIHSRRNTPSDQILLDILNQSKQYFQDYPNHSWREWDIDNSVYRDAEHKDGEPYDFGTLRSIKKKDLEIASQSL